jgi:hypothetical protein
VGSGGGEKKLIKVIKTWLHRGELTHDLHDGQITLPP